VVRFVYLLSYSLIFCNLLLANILQETIDKAPDGAILKLPNGVYKGNIIINKPISIIGNDKNKVIIQGDGNSTVVIAKGSYITIKNLTIQGSGSRHEALDAGIKLSDGKQNEISNCTIKDCLFGIDLQMVSNSIVSNNTITSKDVDLGLRGDGLRLWYSNDNILRKNHITKSRDFVVWYSHGNLIEENIGEFGRYSLHFMYAGKNIVKKNVYKHNTVGIFFMYSRDTEAYDNIIMSSMGTTGIGIGLKDATNFTIKNNTILYCAKGFYIDRSPFQPDERNFIENNKILYNSVAIQFHSVSENNKIVNNIFKGNMENVYDDSGAKIIHSIKNEWNQNFWDDYEGFDKNKDGIGDTPHNIYYYADQIWISRPNVRFFYGSTVISVLNFLAKLAPFSEPMKLLTDPKPLMNDKGKIL